MITQKEFFNGMAEKWDTVCHHDTIKIRHILDLLDIAEGTKILDVGAGTGILIPFLSELVGDTGVVNAIDVSEKMLEVAQRKYSYKNVIFTCGDVLDTSFQRDYFDYVICYSVFPHFDEKQSAISIMSKLLKAGGKFIICHSQSREAINNLHKKASEAVAEDNLPSADIIKGFFEKANMRTVCIVDNGEMFVIIAQK